MSGYAHELAFLTTLRADVIEAEDIGVHAVEFAARGWRVFPLSGKVPAIPTAHRAGDPLRGQCKGGCGRLGHGVLDATTDLEQVTTWWQGRYAGANIGVRLPDAVMVLDSDPRNGGAESLDRLVRTHGALPQTLTALSGRGDGGAHRYFTRPSGKVTARGLGPGLDLKTSSGYVVAPPSIHPDTGRAYSWVDRAELVTDPPGWLVDLIRVVSEPVERKGRTGHKGQNISGWDRFTDSPAETFTRSTTWPQVLEPHGWRCLDPDPDADGARWLHPAATSACSATVRHGCLFVYSDNTPFEPTTAGDPHGLTRFRAHAILNHRGDLSEAARAFRLTGAI